jgi:ABC-2 type transport system permease protein
MDHMEDFEKGIIDTTHVIYYLSVTGFSLFLTQRIIESRSWR